MLINEFYANREVFITGCTGYLGKALLEKLLRDCTKIKVFYILLRSKRNVNVEERLEQLKKDKVFERIREKCPDVLNKLHPIAGSTDQLGLGIQASDLKLLQNVSVIFHMAANVRFDDPLRNSILVNTRGTHELLKIAETLKNLVAFMHCSTAYCNPFEDVVEEKVYQMPVDWRAAIKIAETVDESTLNCLFYKYTGYYPNTYCFTKNLSEQIIKEYSTKLPISLFRPSIVMNAHREPAPGWTDNLNGPLAGMVAIGVGILPSGYGTRYATLDTVPIDFVTKLTIVATYKRGMQFLRKEPVPNGLEVMNCASGKIYEVHMQGAVAVYNANLRKNPMENKIWHYGDGAYTNCYYYFMLQIFVLSVSLALLLDTCLCVMRKKPMAIKMCRRIVYATEATYFFSTRQYKMINENVLNLQNSIPPSELGIYGVEVDMNLNFTEYLDNIIKGIKYYLFDQPKEATAGARRRATILIIASRTIKAFVVSLFVLYLWTLVQKLF